MIVSNFIATDKGALKATFDLTLKTEEGFSFTIRKMLLFEKEGRQWISFPSEKYKKGEKTEYFDLVKIAETDKKTEVQNLILRLVKIFDSPSKVKEAPEQMSWDFT